MTVSLQPAGLWADGLGELFELQMDGATDEVLDRYVDVLVDAIHHGFSLRFEKTVLPDGAGH